MPSVNDSEQILMMTQHVSKHVVILSDIHFERELCLTDVFSCYFARTLCKTG